MQTYEFLPLVRNDDIFQYVKTKDVISISRHFPPQARLACPSFNPRHIHHTPHIVYVRRTSYDGGHMHSTLEITVTSRQ